MIIGICGKSCCGKSSLAEDLIKLSDKEIVHLNIDNVGHEVITLPDIKDKLIKTFGESIIVNDTINRSNLGKIVFNSKEEMDKLTNITWDKMQEIIDEFINTNKDKIIILDWLLLPKSKYFNMCNIKILLDIPYEIRKERAIKRDNITEEKFDLRVKASLDYDKESFDYVFMTNDIDNIKRLVKLL